MTFLKRAIPVILITIGLSLFVPKINKGVWLYEDGVVISSVCVDTREEIDCSDDFDADGNYESTDCETVIYPVVDFDFDSLCYRVELSSITIKTGWISSRGAKKGDVIEVVFDPKNIEETVSAYSKYSTYGKYVLYLVFWVLGTVIVWFLLIRE